MDRDQNGRKNHSLRKVNTAEQSVLSAAPERQHKRTAREMEEKIRYQQQQKQKRLKIQRRRALIALILCVTAVIVLMFMTPIFNIKQIAVSGNSVVTLEEINEKVGDLIGENLFKTGEKDISRRLTPIPYIDSVSVSKNLIPPIVRIAVTECKPAAYIGIDSQTFVIDSSLKVLGDRSVFSEGNIPNVIGIETVGGSVGKTLTGDDTEKLEILQTALKTMEQTGMLDKVKNLDLAETTNISFRYEDRLDVLCGTQLDLERKLRLLKETVSNNNLAENANGTIDLSVTGKAVYTPDIYSGGRSDYSSDDTVKSNSGSGQNTDKELEWH